MIAPGLTNPIDDCLAGAIIGLFVGLLSILVISIGRWQWSFFIVRLVLGTIGGAVSGAICGLVQALIFSGPRWFEEMLIPLGTITIGAAVGALLCAKLVNYRWVRRGLSIRPPS